MPQTDEVRRRAVLLSDSSVGVTTESKTRKMQVNHDGVFFTSLSPEWVSQLNIAEQSAETLHSLSLGVRPVIVQQPAVIVQPAKLVNQENGQRPNGGSSPW